MKDKYCIYNVSCSLCSTVILFFFPLTVPKLFCHHDYAYNRIHDTDDMKKNYYDQELFPISHFFNQRTFFLYTLWQVDKAPMEYNQRNGIYTCQNDGTLGSSSEYSWYHTSAPERSNRELAQVLSLGHRQKTSTDSTDPITISNLIILLKQQ